MTVEFHASLYEEPAVRAAADAFSELATITVVREGDTIRASFDGDDQELADELANHALFETARTRGVS